MRMEPDGLFLELSGIMLNVALVSTKYMSLVSTSVRKIKPELVGKCTAVAMASVGIEAVKPSGARRHLSYTNNYKVSNSLLLCSPKNSVSYTCHWRDFRTYGRGLGQMGDFVGGHHYPFCCPSVPEPNVEFCYDWL